MSTADAYRDTAWFKAAEGDIVFFQWLLDRCFELCDVKPTQSEQVAQNLYDWFKLRQTLRLELGLTSTEAEPQQEVKKPLWAAEKIVEEVGGALQMLRQELEDENSSNPLEVSKLEREVVAEVVQDATELLLSRATREDEVLLLGWLEILDGGGGFWLWEGQSRDAGQEACEQVEGFLELLQNSVSGSENEISVPKVPLDAETLWASEVQRIEGMSLEEEEKREAVAQEIEFMLLYDLDACSEWRVKVFGSSKSRFGSPASDLDMCLFTSLNDYFPSEVLGFYYLKRLMEQKVWNSDNVLVATIERVEQLKKARQQILEAIKTLYNVKDPKHRQVAPLFAFHMQLLVEALDGELDQLNLNARSRLEVFTNSHFAQKELLRVSKRRKNDLFELKSMLECSSACTIDAVASHARVPVLRFRYMRNGVEYKCDLCFDNELGMRNTRLLRAYADFDDRARELGLAVKHWAKQRGIADTASGFLSSYSFVLLSIYYLQIVHVLPNLQDPKLVELAKVSPEYYDSESTAVCEDRDIAHSYHKQASPDSNYLDASLPALLLGFFKFYATQFDYLKHVVTIRSPEKSTLKISQWGRKSKMWRMSIQDPLQTSRDVGGVLHFSAQRKFTHELRRAHKMLDQGESFLDAVCLKQE
ncbi:hypothetical protein PRIC2_008001 [Phytophthora ramorum]